MSKPTYEELEAEVERLRSVSFGDDKEFTLAVKSVLQADFATADKFRDYTSGQRIVIRPGEMWNLLFAEGDDVLVPSTNDLAILGRSLQALGWQRSALRGNVVFKMAVEDYPDAGQD